MPTDSNPPETPARLSPPERHGIVIAPPPTAASPHGIEFEDGIEQWWRPSLGDVWKHLGYRKLMFLPALGVIAFLIATVFNPSLLKIFWWFGVKWGIALLGIPFAMAGNAAVRAISNRSDLFCIHCGYSLEGLPDQSRCPECGRWYSHAQIEEYRRDSEWFIRRWRQRHQIPQGHGQIMAGPYRRKSRNRDGT